MVTSEISATEALGQDFGPYTIVRRLGVGGMAETFEAVRRGRSGFSRRVCLKLVRPAYREDKHSIQLFEREARLAAKLHHSNIVGVIDFGDIEGTLYMALELVDGVDLRRLLDARKQLSAEYVALLGHRLASALQHAHNPLAEEGIEGLGTGGILHRDISPANVLLSHYGEIKLTDFGLANVAAEGSRQSTVKGKFPYMAPERLRDEPLDGRSDLFSLGILMFEALSGRRPYEGGHEPATIMLIIEGEHTALRELVPTAPEGLCEIIENLLQSDREHRPRSAAALVEALDPFVPPPGVGRKLGKMVVATREASDSLPPLDAPVAASPTPHGPPPGGWSRRQLGKRAAWLALTLAGGVGGLALWANTRGNTEGADPSPAAPAEKPRVTEPHPVVKEDPPEAPEPAPATGREEPPRPTQTPSLSPTAKPARLTVLVSPWGNIWINGRARGAAPLKNASLKSGQYEISAGRGKPSKSQTVRLRAGQRKTIRFDLSK